MRATRIPIEKEENEKCVHSRSEQHTDAQVEYQLCRVMLAGTALDYGHSGSVRA